AGIQPRDNEVLRGARGLWAWLAQRPGGYVPGRIRDGRGRIADVVETGPAGGAVVPSRGPGKRDGLECRGGGRQITNRGRRFGVFLRGGAGQGVGQVQPAVRERRLQPVVADLTDGIDAAQNPLFDLSGGQARKRGGHQGGCARHLGDGGGNAGEPGKTIRIIGQRAHDEHRGRRQVYRGGSVTAEIGVVIVEIGARGRNDVVEIVAARKFRLHIIVL